VTRSLDGDVRCSACEQHNSPSARFCRHCGARRGAFADSVPPAPETAQASAPEIISSSDFPLSGRAAARRSAALAAAAIAVVATLALVGWQAHWPAALFAAKQPPTAQVGGVAGVRSPRVITSSLPSSPTVAASTPGHATSAPATSSPATSASAANPASQAAAGSRGSSPAATVKAYFRAINSGNYAKAWRLGGRNTGVSYARFAAGFAGTARDALKVLSVAGDAVTARLAARQTDGTTKSFEGIYTVDRGVITQFAVQQVS
jgi:hypothetical protein